MKARKVYKAVKTKFKRIEKLTSGNVLPAKDEIHDLRVSYKKLRAILRLLNYSGGRKGSGLPAKLKDLYKRAGTLRDLQLHETKFSEEIGPGWPLNFLFNKISNAEMDFIKANDAVNWQKINHNLRKHFRQKLSKSTLRQYITNRKAELDDLVRVGLTDMNLHAVRKIIKDVIYLHEIFGKRTGCRKMEIEEYKQLADLLGAYNDLVNEESFARDLGNEQTESLPNLTNLQEDIIRNKAKLKMEINGIFTNNR